MCILLLHEPSFPLISAYHQLEGQLESLGQRWANVCKWVEEHWVILQERLAKHQLYDDQLQAFSSWLDEKDKVLAHMVDTGGGEISQVIEQVRQLKVR